MPKFQKIDHGDPSKSGDLQRKIEENWEERTQDDSSIFDPSNFACVRIRINRKGNSELLIEIPNKTNRYNKSKNKIHSEPLLLAAAINEILKNYNNLPEGLQKIIKEKNLKEIDMQPFLSKKYPTENMIAAAQENNKNLWEEVLKFTDVLNYNNWDDSEVTVELFSERETCDNSGGAGNGCEQNINKLLPADRHSIYFAYSNQEVPAWAFSGRIIQTFAKLLEKDAVQIGNEILVEECQEIVEEIDSLINSAQNDHNKRGTLESFWKEFNNDLRAFQNIIKQSSAQPAQNLNLNQVITDRMVNLRLQYLALQGHLGSHADENGALPKWELSKYKKSAMWLESEKKPAETPASSDNKKFFDKNEKTPDNDRTTIKKK